jgi:hypothetical protein
VTTDQFRGIYIPDHVEQINRDLGRLQEIGARFDPYSEEEIELSQDEVDEIRAINLEILMESAFEDADLVDYDRLSAMLKHTSVLAQLDDDARERIATVLLENLEHLYPLAGDVTRFFAGFESANSQVRRRIAKRLTSTLLAHSNRRPPDYFVCWILSIFASSSRWSHAREVLRIFREYRSDAVRRYAALALACVGGRPEALQVRDEYIAASPGTRLAILLASRNLGADERRHWRQAVQVEGVIERLI